MKRLKFDELNILHEDYFEPMAISVDDKERRRELADFLTDAFLYFFSVYEVHLMHNQLLEKAMYEQILADRISDAVSKVTGIDSEISNHIRALSKEVVDTTFKNAKPDTTNLSVRQSPSSSRENIPFLTALYQDKEPSELPLSSGGSPFLEEDPAISVEEDEVEDLMEKEAVVEYWLSIHRAINIAQNEANTFLNYSDFLDAKDRGYTQKTWLTMLDSKVRDTHEEVEGQTVGIDEYFQVGNSEMRFPHDWLLAPDPKETINCRCAVDYTK